MLRLTELIIRNGGFETLCARDGREGVELAGRELPALIIMDVTMPELDGFGALQLLKQSPATQNIPVIMLTSRGHTLTRQQAKESGAALLLTKPFSPSQLLDEVRRLIAHA